MRAEFHLCGRIIDMSTQHRRRQLVISIYAAALLILAVGYPLDHWHMSGNYLMIGLSLLSQHVLGGQGINGLIKPFNNRQPRPSAEPPSILALHLRVYDPLPADDARRYQNDERELAQRDRAHYRAYTPLIFVLLALWLVAGFALHVPRLTHWLPVEPLVVVEGIVLVGLLLAITLPQAILLWTEPDMDNE